MGALSHCSRDVERETRESGSTRRTGDAESILRMGCRALRGKGILCLTTGQCETQRRGHYCGVGWGCTWGRSRKPSECGFLQHMLQDVRCTAWPLAVAPVTPASRVASGLGGGYG